MLLLLLYGAWFTTNDWVVVHARTSLAQCGLSHSSIQTPVSNQIINSKALSYTLALALQLIFILWLNVSAIDDGGNTHTHKSVLSDQVFAPFELMVASCYSNLHCKLFNCKIYLLRIWGGKSQLWQSHIIRRAATNWSIFCLDWVFPLSLSLFDISRNGLRWGRT